MAPKQPKNQKFTLILKDQDLIGQRLMHSHSSKSAQGRQSTARQVRGHWGVPILLIVLFLHLWFKRTPKNIANMHLHKLYTVSIAKLEFPFFSYRLRWIHGRN